MNIAFDSLWLMNSIDNNRESVDFYQNFIHAHSIFDNSDNYFFLNLFNKKYFQVKNISITEVMYPAVINEIFIYENEPKFFEQIIKNFIEKYHIDLFYCTSPFQTNVPILKREYFSCKVISLCLNTIPPSFMENYVKENNEFENYRARIENLKKSDNIFALSQTIKDDLVKLSFSSDKIHVINKNFTDKCYNNNEKKRLHELNWENIIKQLIEIINQFQNREHKQADISKNNAHQPLKRIAFFTPLPPIQSGISDYSYDIITALSAYFKIDVYIDKGYTPSCVFKENVRIFDYTLYSTQRQIYYKTIYQIGNSAYHIYMWEILRKYPGILVLHDYNLHGTFTHSAVIIEKNINKLLEYASPDLSEKQLSFFQSNLSKWKLSDKLELNGYLTNFAAKIIVHSDYSLKKLLEKNINADIRKIYHYAIPEQLNKTIAREELKIAEQEIIIAVFGIIHESKRPIPILKAFSLLHKLIPNTKLIFIGKFLGMEKKFKKSIQMLQLSDVEVTGYTDIAAFIKYISACDICLNLRHPYNGETSGSLMRIFAHGKPVIINDIGSFSEFNEDMCVKLKAVENMSEQEEIESIYHAMYTLLTDAEYRNRIAINALKFAKENLDIRIIAKKYAEVINDDSINLFEITPEFIQSLSEKYKAGILSDDDIKNIVELICQLQKK